LPSRVGRAIATLLNFYVSHGSAVRFEEMARIIIIIIFVDNLLLFATMKEFSKSVNS